VDLVLSYLAARHVPQHSILNESYSCNNLSLYVTAPVRWSCVTVPLLAWNQYHLASSAGLRSEIIID
jgi:hypothetical protein